MKSILFISSLLVLLVLASATSPVPATVRDPMTVTPFGVVPSRCVVGVPSGSHIFYNEDESSAFVKDPTDTVTVLPDCREFHRSFSAKRLEASDQSAGRKATARVDGWQVYAQYINTSQSFSTFNGFFTVPKAPASFTGTVLYLFTGLQGTSSSGLVDIIQPVLQYGDSNAGDANGWGVASWYVTSTGSFLFSKPLVAVNPGDSIDGIMQKSGTDTWLIEGSSKLNGQSTNISVTHSILRTQTQAYCTLESYGLTGCSNYPANSCVFSNLVLQTASGAVTPAWQPVVNAVTCKTAKAIVNSPSSVTIKFQ